MIFLPIANLTDVALKLRRLYLIFPINTQLMKIYSHFSFKPFSVSLKWMHCIIIKDPNVLHTNLIFSSRKSEPDISYIYRMKGCRYPVPVTGLQTYLLFKLKFQPQTSKLTCLWCQQRWKTAPPPPSPPSPAGPWKVLVWQLVEGSVLFPPSNDQAAMRDCENMAGDALHHANLPLHATQSTCLTFYEVKSQHATLLGSQQSTCLTF